MVEVKEGVEGVHPEEVVDGTTTITAVKMEVMRSNPRGVGAELDVAEAVMTKMEMRGVVAEVVAGVFVLFINELILFTQLLLAKSLGLRITTEQLM